MKLALEIVAAVRSGSVSATAVIERHLSALTANDNAYVAVTRVLADRARQEAALVDAAIGRGEDPEPLAGEPYGVKDLFDIAGFPTTAGSALHATAMSARPDAEAIRLLREAGAVLVATLNMDEFAYGFARARGCTKAGRGLQCVRARTCSSGRASSISARPIDMACGSGLAATSAQGPRFRCSIPLGSPIRLRSRVKIRSIPSGRFTLPG